MKMHWALPIIFEDGSEVEFTKLTHSDDWPEAADSVELGGEARFFATVGYVVPQETTLVRFKPHKATPAQLEWLNKDGWAAT